MYAGAITNGGRKAKIPYGVRFNPYRHEPGDRTVMGKVYKAKGKGENLLRELIDDLAVHPATAKFLALKLGPRLHRRRSAARFGGRHCHRLQPIRRRHDRRPFGGHRGGDREGAAISEVHDTRPVAARIVPHDRRSRFR